MGEMHQKKDEIMLQNEQRVEAEAVQHYPWLAHYEPQVPAHIEIPEISLHEFFEKTASDYPNNTATIFFGEHLTYAQLDEQANRLAASLQSLGVQQGDRVAIILPNCPQFLVALYGSLKAGAIAIPLNPAYVARELCAQFNDAGVETVIAMSTVAHRVQEIMAETPVKRLIVTNTWDYLSPLMSMMLMVKERTDGTAVNVAGDNIHTFMGLLASDGSSDYVRSRAEPGETAVLLYTGGYHGHAQRRYAEPPQPGSQRFADERVGVGRAL
jgi:long-chain acyl-CoA synthetase